jgi:hypothetical protein
MGSKNVNNAQKAKDVKDIAKHILYIPWFTGETTGGHWSLVVWYKHTHGKVAFYYIDSLNQLYNMPLYHRTHLHLGEPKPAPPKLDWVLGRWFA